MKKILSLLLLSASVTLFSMDNDNENNQVSEDNTGFFDLENKRQKEFWDTYKLGNCAEADEVFLKECSLRGKEPFPDQFKAIDAQSYYQGGDEKDFNSLDFWKIQQNLPIQLLSEGAINKPRHKYKLLYYTIISPHIKPQEKQKKLDTLWAIDLPKDLEAEYGGAMRVINDVIENYNNLVIDESSDQLDQLKQKTSGDSNCLIS